MKRPAFQFYTGDWQGNAKLRRCTHAEKGVWIDVMCLMHDSDEYGVIRWPLKEIAQAVGCKVADLRALRTKGVLKGADIGERTEEFIYKPRHAGKDGDPVSLLPAQDGPIWFSSRMVRDEYIRSKRGDGTRFGDAPKVSPKPTPIGSPTHPIGETLGGGQGYGPSSSSSTSYKDKSISPPGFVSFWEAWPKGDRKQGKSKCLTVWSRKGLEKRSVEIIAHVEAMKRTKGWMDGYEPMPQTYLNGERWDGAEAESGGVKVDG